MVHVTSQGHVEKQSWTFSLVRSRLKFRLTAAALLRSWPQTTQRKTKTTKYRLEHSLHIPQTTGDCHRLPKCKFSAFFSAKSLRRRVASSVPFAHVRRLGDRRTRSVRTGHKGACPGECAVLVRLALRNRMGSDRMGREDQSWTAYAGTTRGDPSSAAWVPCSWRAGGFSLAWG